MEALLKEPSEKSGKPLESRPFTSLPEEELEKALAAVVSELWKPLEPFAQNPS